MHIISLYDIEILHNVYSSIHNINYIIIIIYMSGYIICVDLKSLGAGLAVRSQVVRHETCTVKKTQLHGTRFPTIRMLMMRQSVLNGRILHNKSDIREGMTDWRWE